mmetsp:Transcript_21434/g.66846  ORF Transcript_21434/g.66846 Transcript_21434/m.66846 type:complete len:368 (+) Transcript_21434:49-1152(+)
MLWLPASANCLVNFEELDDEPAAEHCTPEAELPPIPSLDGEWKCLVDYFKTGRLVDVSMHIEGHAGRYHVAGRAGVNRLSDIVAQRDGSSVTVSFRWANRNGWVGGGAWALRGSGDCLDGSWWHEGDAARTWLWSAMRKGATGPPPSVLGLTPWAVGWQAEASERLPLPSIDGEWLCLCENFTREGGATRVAMTIEGSSGRYYLQGDDQAHELSDIAAHRRGSSLALSFRWAHRAGPQGSGCWALLAAGGVLEGSWTKDGSAEKPWGWTAARLGPPPAPPLVASTAAFVQRLRAGQPQHVVAYGTSLTAGGAWVWQLERALKQAFPGLATIANSGAEAVHCGWALEELRGRVLGQRPDALLLEFAVD